MKTLYETLEDSQREQSLEFMRRYNQLIKKAEDNYAARESRRMKQAAKQNVDTTALQKLLNTLPEGTKETVLDVITGGKPELKEQQDKATAIPNRCIEVVVNEYNQQTSLMLPITTDDIKENGRHPLIESLYRQCNDSVTSCKGIPAQAGMVSCITLGSYKGFLLINTGRLMEHAGLEQRLLETTIGSYRIRPVFLSFSYEPEGFARKQAGKQLSGSRIAVPKAAGSDRDIIVKRLTQGDSDEDILNDFPDQTSRNLGAYKAHITRKKQKKAIERVK